MKTKNFILFTGIAMLFPLCLSSCLFADDDSENKITDSEKGTLVWSDEFNYNGKPKEAYWDYETGAGGWGNNELQNYQDNSNGDVAVVRDGTLKIKAYYDNGVWKSARMVTKGKKHWKYGYIEARMKVTDKKGAWPAFWMMPQDSVYGVWPKSGEIDIMENAPGIAGEHKVFSSLHAEGHYDANPAPIGSKMFDSSLSSEWHTFAVKWNKDSISAYYDDVQQGIYYNNGKGYKDWPYDKDFFIILNLAIGGKLGGDTSTLPTDGVIYEIDYVRVYQ